MILYLSFYLPIMYLPKGLMKAGGAPDPFLPCLKSPQAMEAVAAVDKAEYAAW